MSNVHESTTYVPLDCPVCQYMMRDSRDVSQYYISKCCVDCWIGFLEPLRLRNKDNEYLPNSAELKAYRKKIAQNVQNGEEGVELKRD